MASLPTPAEVRYQEMHATDDKSSSIIAANAACLAIGITAVILRFVSRRLSKIKYEADDWLVVAGMVFMLGVVINDALAVRWGLGKHSIFVTNVPGFVKVLIAAEVLYNFAVMCLKGSVLYLYHRVFFVSHNFNIALWVIALFVAAYSITQAFASIFQCLPIDANWTVGKPHYCINVPLGATIIAILNVITDFAILILPMPLLYRLHKPLNQKLQVMGMFLLGGFVCMASIYRCIIIHDLNYLDPTWSDISTDIWTMVELGVGTVSVCLPTYRPLFHHVFGKAGSSSTRGSSGGEKNPSGETLASQSLSPQHSRSNPNNSKKFSQLGVLGDLEEAHVAEDGF